MKIQPFKRQGFYTVFDNVLLDHVMPIIKLSSWAVLCFIMRKTIGWQKESDEVSYSQIKSGTGIKSDATIRSAIEELENNGLVLIQTQEGLTSFYTLNREFTIDVPDKRSGTSSKNEEVTPSKNEEVPLQKLKTQKKGNNYNNSGDTEQEFGDIRSEPDYRDLQNEVIAACKKLNALSLKEEDVKNIDILYASEVKPAQVREYFSRNGQSSWWCTQHWKGKKGQFPTTQDVIDTIEQARAYVGSPDDAADAALQEVKEWIRGKRKFGDFSSIKTIPTIRAVGEHEMKNKAPQFWAIRFKETFESV